MVITVPDHHYELSYLGRSNLTVTTMVHLFMIWFIKIMTVTIS